MTQRLPTPGGDDGNWGTILNGFLEVSLNSDGTLNSSVVADAQVATGANINPSKIAGTAEVQSNKGAASGYAPLNSSSLVPTTNLGTGTASSSNYLRGDGTWVAVGGGGSSTLASDSDVSITSPSNNQVLTYNSGTSTWINQTPSSAPVSTVFGRTGAVVATTGDYTAAQVTGALLNTNNLSDVSSTTTARTNLGLGSAATQASSVFAQTANNLSDLASTSTARTNLGLGAAATENIGTTSGTVAAGNDSRITGAIQTGATAGGDLSGTLPSPTVAKINGITLSGTPSNGQVLTATSGTAADWQTPGALAVGVAAPTGTSATDTANIQNAINQVSTAGGGIVWLQNGTYMVDSSVNSTFCLDLPSFVHLWGQGREGTIIELANSQNCDIIHTHNFSSYTWTGTSNGAFNWSIRHLIIDGNFTNNSSGGVGVSAYGADFQIEDISIRNCGSHGLFSEWEQAGGTSNPDNSMEAHITNCHIHDNHGWGWDCHGPHDSVSTANIIFQNYAGNLRVQQWGNAVIQAGSIGATLSTGLVIQVDNTLGWPASGSMVIPTSGGNITASFSSVTATTITLGSASYSGTLSSGNCAPLGSGNSAGGLLVTANHFWGAHCAIALEVDTLAYFSNCEAEGATTGEILWRTSDGSWIGGAVFTGSGSTVYGLQLGDTNYTNVHPTNNTFITTFNGFTNSGANNTAFVANRTYGYNRIIITSVTSGSPVYGSLSGSDQAIVLATVQSGSFQQSYGKVSYDTGSQSNALKVTNAGTDGFNVNTANSRTEIVNGYVLRGYSDNYTTITWTMDSAKAHQYMGGAAPSFAAGANNGSTPPTPTTSNGNDSRGTIAFGSGSGPAAGDQVDLTYAQAWTSTPLVVITPLNSATQALGLYVSAYTAAGFSISSANAPSGSEAGTFYQVAYHVLG